MLTRHSRAGLRAFVLRTDLTGTQNQPTTSEIIEAQAFVLRTDLTGTQIQPTTSEIIEAQSFRECSRDELQGF
jgi:hypothetical protein